MKKVAFFTLMCIFILGMLLIPQSTIVAQADNPDEATETPTAVVYPTVILPTDKVTNINLFPPTPSLEQLERGENVSFRVLGAKDTGMVGPYSSYFLNVGIPYSWKLAQSAKLSLKVNLNIARVASDKERYKQWLGPRLDVYFDDVYVTSFRITNNGDYTFDIPLPVDHMKLSKSGAHYLFLYLDATYDCDLDQSSVLTIKADSYFTLPHEKTQQAPNLNNFPVPFFQASSFIPNQVTLVVPDNATDTELQSALTVAAGLGRMTTNVLQLVTIPFSQVTDQIRKSTHMIYVGKGSSLPYLATMPLPAPLEGSQFKAAGAQLDDGFLQMVVSNANPEKMVLIVGGNSEAGVLKAAKAVSTGVIRATQNPKLAIISNVEAKNVSTVTTPIDRTFASLGYQNVTLEGLGLVSTEYVFTLPGGFFVGDDAYLDFAYSHSSLLDFERSSISVILNGVQVNSIPYSDEDRTEKTTPYRFLLPAYAFVSGINSLVVETSHVNDYCTYYSTGEMWTTIYDKSLLHIPPAQQVERQTAHPAFTNYPRPLSDDPELESVAFVVSKGDPGALFTASKIAENLGRSTRSGLVNLNAVFSGNLSDEMKNGKSLVIVGKPADLPIIAELKAYLPAPFADGSNTADESSLSVSYRMAPGTSIGYMEFFESPWNADKVILAALGSTTEGLQWAGTALTDPTFVTQLIGNYAVTNGKEVYGVNTELGSGTMNIAVTASPAMAVTVSPSSLAVDAVPTGAVAKKTTLFDVDPKLWVPYVIVILTIITILVIIIVVALNIKKRRDEKFKIHNPQK
jgi:hypothetical protein